MSEILTKIKSTADILGGTVFFANENGQDPEFIEVEELLPNGMYIRLEGSDGSLAYVSAHEIDKAIGIIGQMSMSKASQADVDAIIETLNDKVSKTELELLKTDIADKVGDDAFNDLAGLVANKAERSEIEDLNDKIANKVERDEIEVIQSKIDEKASMESINLISEDINNKALEISRIKNDISTIQTALESVTDSNSISALQNQINYLNSELNKKLEIDDLSGVVSSIGTLMDTDSAIIERISNAETNINKKATKVYVQGQVNELNNAITGISARVDSKADKETVAKKASKTDLDALTSKVTSLSNEFNDTKNDFETLNNTVYVDLSNKVSKDEFETKTSEIEASLNTKSTKVEHIEDINRITTRIDDFETTTEGQFDQVISDIDELECNINNSLAELRSNVNAQTKQLNNQATQITKLQEVDKAHNEKLKTEWVRVMTPEAYKKLPPIGDTYTDGTPNPYAKQPNIIYMLVRYNKPIAVYIGDVLIAQAEQKGSVGFAYSFPISF